MHKLTRSLLAVGAVIGLAACGDDVTVTPPTPAPAPTVTGVSVSPASTTIKVGESVVFSAALTTTGTVANTAVTWSSANAAIASVNASGSVTGVAVGTTTIRATSAANTSATGAGSVTVVAPGVQSVSVTPNAAAVTVGQSFTAVANVTRDAGVAGTVTWASSAASIASVSAAGVVTGVAPGTAVITATSTADVTKAASLSVTVTQQANALQSLSVTPTTVNIGPGGTLTLTTITQAAAGATVAYANSSSNPAVVTVTPTGANAVVTGVTNGTAVVTITATGSGAGLSTNSISQTVTVNINAASVSIASLTTCAADVVPSEDLSSSIAAPCTVIPVNLAATLGQIEATLNINSGSQTIDRVVVYIDSDSAAAQVFGVNGAPNAPITLSINTAYFNPTTYAPRHLNGVHNMTAKIYPVGPNPSPTASNTVQFTLTNPDVVYFNPTGIAHLGNSAVDGGGATWWKDGFTFTGHVVNYSNAITGVTYTSTGAASAYSDAANCGAETGTTGPAFTATFACAVFEGPQNMANAVGVTYTASYTLTAPPTGFMTAASAGFVPGNPVYAVVSTNEDNVGPRTNTPAYNGVNFAGWHGNGSAGVSVWGSVYPGTTYSVAATDLGVGLLAAAPTTTEVTTGLTPVTAANQLAQTPTPAPYYLRGNATSDILGNAGYSTGSVCTGCFGDAGVFGVDLVVTDAQYSNRATSALTTLYPLTPVGTGGNATIYTAAGWAAVEVATTQNVAVDAIDVNGSGLDNAVALTQRIHRSNPNTQTDCLLSTTYGMGAGFGGFTLGDNYVQSGVQQLDCGLLATARVGRYSWASYVKDRAGNVLVPRQGTVSSVTPLDSVYVIIDEAAPNITGVGFQTALYTGGQPAAFSFSANDDYEIQDGLVTLTYGNVPGVGFTPWTNAPPTLTYNYGAALFTPVAFAASPWDNTWVNVLNGQTLTLNYLIGNLETVAAGGVVAGFTSSGIINNAAANVRDWAGQVGAGISAPILSTQVGATGAVAWGTVTSTGGSGPAGNMSTWHILSKTATTVTVEQIGVTSTSLAACGRVDIYEGTGAAVAGPLDAATTTNLVWRAQGNFTQATTPFTDNGIQRFYSYTITIPASIGTGVYTAVCVQSGRGLGTELF